MTTPADAPRDLLDEVDEWLSSHSHTREAEPTLQLYRCADWLFRLVQRVRTAEAETGRLREALVNLKRGACWCEVGIGNPMVRGVHSNACQRALDVVGASRPGEPR